MVNPKMSSKIAFGRARLSIFVAMGKDLQLKL